MNLKSQINKQNILVRKEKENLDSMYDDKIRLESDMMTYIKQTDNHEIFVKRDGGTFRLAPDGVKVVVERIDIVE